ncbi:Osmotin, thaumatin-like protein [Daldinia caldariorum]|uniref:Osmotin, thaumatin-like protein n=1 Tax=Daldinia caldariorum TaxID=326644 RepID=UPI002008479D|nr:Osmotin, thaumatin-like protein [Daldinia caldariorum]KAI1467608.1 Osmotin, thaumatin-like protein [Daldinia caldariorum]
MSSSAFMAPVTLALLGFCHAAMATPIEDVSPPAVTQPPQVATAVGQAEEFIFTVINSHTAAVSTLHVAGAGSPPVTKVVNEANTIAPGETISFAAPTGWFGRLALYEHGYDIVDRATLLEGSFFMNGDHASMAMDVSYVDAFTVPVVCECEGKVQLGCNLDLQEVCPKELQLNGKTCVNPYRDDPQHPPGAENIFKDCQGIAYTFPTDDLATKVDLPGCSRSITCCIGTACKHHPGQLKCPMKDGYAQDCAKGA